MALLSHPPVESRPARLGVNVDEVLGKSETRLDLRGEPAVIHIQPRRFDWER